MCGGLVGMASADRRSGVMRDEKADVCGFVPRVGGASGCLSTAGRSMMRMDNLVARARHCRLV